MPIINKTGSIFDTKAEVIVIPVNCVGVMGAGLAKEAKRRWPEDFHRYKELCRGGAFKPGSIGYWETMHFMFATKNHWRDPSELKWICMGLVVLANIQKKYAIRSIALPRLGCGCGGLDWGDVEPLIHKHLGELDCNVEVWNRE